MVVTALSGLSLSLALLTMPLMGFTLFVSIALLAWLSRKSKKYPVPFYPHSL